MELLDDDERGHLRLQGGGQIDALVDADAGSRRAVGRQRMCLNIGALPVDSPHTCAMPRTRPAMTGALPCLRRRFATSLPRAAAGTAPMDTSLEHKAFLLLLGLVTVAFCWLLIPFYGAVFWAVILAIIFQPLQVVFERRFGMGSTLAAGAHHARLHRHRHHPDGGDPRGAGERGGAAGAEHPERRLRHLDAGARRPGDAAGLGAAPARALRHRRGSRGDARPLHRRPAADRPAPRHPGR